MDYIKSLEDYEEIKDYLDLSFLDEDIDESTFPQFTPDFSTAIVVDNIPSVSKEKIPKLITVLLKIYSQLVNSLVADDIFMPLNESTGLTYGFCFIKFARTEDAENAMKSTQDFALDKNHKFKVNMYSDLEYFAKLPLEFKPPQQQPFNPRPDPTAWLTDPSGRDQFVVRHSRETEIYWGNHTGEAPTLVYGGEREKEEGNKVWCESFVTWSPQGTYLATFHDKGIRLWGSGDFTPQGRFAHPRVENASFSPCENYLITYRFFQQEGSFADAIIVWDVRTRAKIRSFELKNPLDLKFQVQATLPPPTDGSSKKAGDRVIRGRVKAYENGEDGGYFSIEEGNNVHERVPFKNVSPMQEPNRLKWSPDGQYVARSGCDIISVYELPGMTLLDRKSIAAKDVLDFVWSPRSNLISYWSPAVKNLPAIISIIKLPSREEICSRKLFDVTDGRMLWQNEGEYLCVHMTKMQGKKKSYVLMFFRVSQPGVPVEQLELTEPILNVSWEPSGDRFVILYGEARSPTVAFYSMSGTNASKSTVIAAATGKGANAPTKNELTHLFTKTGTQCNRMFWSPAGGIIALAYFTGDSCSFELHDVDNNLSLATKRHDRCTRLSWDPSGRFLASCTVMEMRNASVKGNPEDGINFYTFQGTFLCSFRKDRLFDFAWRPRPKDLLTPEEKKKVIKNLRKYEKMFEKEDRQRKQELNQEIQAARYKMAEEFLSWFNRNRAINAALKPKRIAMRGGYDSDDERNYQIEVQVEEKVMKSTDQIVH